MSYKSALPIFKASNFKGLITLFIVFFVSIDCAYAGNSSDVTVSVDHEKLDFLANKENVYGKLIINKHEFIDDESALDLKKELCRMFELQTSLTLINCGTTQPGVKADIMVYADLKQQTDSKQDISIKEIDELAFLLERPKQPKQNIALDIEIIDENHKTIYVASALSDNNSLFPCLKKMLYMFSHKVPKKKE